MPLSPAQRDRIERQIRAAIDRLLAGQFPPGGGCDVKTLAREAGISRAALYRTYGHLKEEFERRRQAQLDAGDQPDPREQRIAALRERTSRLTTKLAATHAELRTLRATHRQALSALAAADDTIQRQRRQLADAHNLLAQQGNQNHRLVPLPPAGGPQTATSAAAPELAKIRNPGERADGYSTASNTAETPSARP
ncbi:MULTISPECIES: hypothetical protein [Prauserella salsuginis group]|uniref:TetR family transcriptional regulator n=1 Tax=Prauserella salsuginis TaxID=387889 RepID=A0ABW6G287_9PSEU|nr:MULTISPECIES: hypothetical protein [Prauserella salsuginis group]MCR3719915.1 hypothetical protein [Prauserella flava]MCR3736542.1 hypothetical protein [Prauserella salsuginis]